MIAARFPLFCGYGDFVKFWRLRCVAGARFWSRKSEADQCLAGAMEAIKIC